jgi:predicted phosphoribosyltransferase
MSMKTRTPHIVDLPYLRNRAQVFHDRAHAGAILADMLTQYHASTAIVFGIPAGGVPIAAVIAQGLQLPLDVAVVSKITLPWNTEAGYGAVAFDGSVCLNEALIAQIALSKHEIEDGIARTRAKVARRVELLRPAQPFPDLARRCVILVDDGLASGFTLETAIAALRKRSGDNIVVAVPTAHATAAQRIMAVVEEFYCPNIREGLRFAVADAYENWHDVAEDTVVSLLKSLQPAAH